MPRPMPKNRSKLALPLVLLLSGGCAAQPQPQPVEIPAPVEKVYIYRPLDAGLLRCKTIRVETGKLHDDLDLSGALNVAVDAWSDCWKHLDCIAKIYAEQECPKEAIKE